MDSEHIWSCVTCRRRKVRCNRRSPCDVCAKNGLECHYPVTGRLPNRDRAPRWSSSHQRQTELLERLRRLEGVVTELSAQVDDVNQRGVTPSATEGSLEMGDEDGGEDFGRLVTRGDGRVKIEKSFWSVFCNEVDHIFQSLQDASEPVEETTSTGQVYAAPCCHGFGLGIDTGCETDIISPEMLQFLLQAYKERVDPFLKVLTTESLHHILNSHNTPTTQLLPPYAALRTSILFAAAVSLSSDEVATTFSAAKDDIISKMRFETETHLSRARYLSATDLTVIQALIIYASILPYANISTTEDISGPIAASTVQIAMQNGLHDPKKRDASGDAGLRLVIWVQVCFLASRHEVADAAVSKWPPDAAAVGDACGRLYPADTDQTAVLGSRLRIWQFSRQVLGADPAHVAALHEQASSDLFAIFQQAKATTGTTTGIIHLLQAMSTLFLARVQHAHLAHTWHKQPPGALFAPYSSNAPRHNLAASLSETTMSVLEITHELQTDTAWAPWQWQLRGSFPWSSLRTACGHLLHDESETWTADADRAWVLMVKVMASAPEHVVADPAWGALRRLVGQATARREREMMSAAEGGADLAALEGEAGRFARSVLFEVDEEKDVAAKVLGDWGDLGVTMAYF